MHASKIHVRDPFIVPVPEEGLYYLYNAAHPKDYDHPAIGFDVYTSKDLVEWDGPFPVFRPDPDFWSDRDFWAPEVHRMNNRYYLFASFKAEGVCRGTQILVSDGPKGPFKPHSIRPVTPQDWESLDGTLYLDLQGNPWMVFCHEWLQVQNGEICAVRLSPELDRAIGEPILLFHATDAPWVYQTPEKVNYITDGPFLHRTENGDLVMLWASFTQEGYAEGIARSESGEITGPWIQNPKPLYSQDGGHAMLFRTFDGQLMMVLHAPNNWPDERLVILPVREENRWVIR